MDTKNLNDIIVRVQELHFAEKFDLIVAIARGGLFPAALIQQKLQVDLEAIWLNLRDENQQPQHDSPQLVKPINFAYEGKSILLVDDRSRTGQTFEKAKELLKGAKSIKTCVVNGKADYPLFDENCFRFPWRLS